MPFHLSANLIGRGNNERVLFLDHIKKSDTVDWCH
jgi:hypothetical protein